MTDTPYTPEDLPEAETPPSPEVGQPAPKPVEHDHADDFDPGSPAADAPAMF